MYGVVSLLCSLVRLVVVLSAAAAADDAAAVVSSKPGTIVRTEAVSSRVVVSGTGGAVIATVTGRAVGGRRVGGLVYVTDGVGRCW